MAVAALGGKIYAFGGETAERRSQRPDPGDRPAGAAPPASSATCRSPISHAAALRPRRHRLRRSAAKRAASPATRSGASTRRAARSSPAGRLPFPVAGAGAAVGRLDRLPDRRDGPDGERPCAASMLLRRAPRRTPPAREARRPPRPTPARARGPPPPFAGRLLIADRGNNRLIVVNADKKVLWRFPSHAHPAPPGGFYFPDDAFFTHGGTQIISNEEQNERIVQLAFPSGKLLWSYGHPGRRPAPNRATCTSPTTPTSGGTGRSPSPTRRTAACCLISPRKKILQAFGDPSRCEHEPPRALGSPNGDTPLRNGDILVSEVNGSYIDEITPARQARLERAAADRIPLRPPAARPRPLPGRRLHRPRRHLRVQPRRQDPLVLPPVLRRRGCSTTRASPSACRTD